MATPVEIAVRTYIKAAETRDKAERDALLHACFAETVRFVTRSTVVRGHAALVAMFDTFYADPTVAGVKVTTRIDAVGSTFRYGSIVEFRDGRTTEFFDTGEIDADGKIVTMLVFAGPL